MTVANERRKNMQLSRAECTWCLCRSRGQSFKEEVWKKMSEATRKCDEKATAVEKLRLGMKSASGKECCL
jgi:hypothetical protein